MREKGGTGRGGKEGGRGRERMEGLNGHITPTWTTLDISKFNS